MPGGLLWTHRRFLGYAWNHTALIQSPLVVMGRGLQGLWNLPKAHLSTFL